MDVDLPSRHGGRLGDLGWALAWVIGALVAAFVVVSATTRVAGSRRGGARPGSVRTSWARPCHAEQTARLLEALDNEGVALLDDQHCPHTRGSGRACHKSGASS